jgi:hypothetical protein
MPLVIKSITRILTAGLLNVSIAYGAPSLCENGSLMRSMYKELQLQMVCAAPDQASRLACNSWIVPAAATPAALLAARKLGSGVGGTSSIANKIDCSGGSVFNWNSWHWLLNMAWAANPTRGIPTCALRQPTLDDTKELVNGLKEQAQLDVDYHKQLSADIKEDFRQQLQKRYEKVADLIKRKGRLVGFSAEENLFLAGYENGKINDYRVFQTQMDQAAKKLYPQAFATLNPKSGYTTWIPTEGFTADEIDKLIKMLEKDPRDDLRYSQAVYDQFGKNTKAHQLVDRILTSHSNVRKATNELNNLATIESLLDKPHLNDANGLAKIHKLIPHISAPVDLSKLIDSARGTFNLVGDSLLASGRLAASSMFRLKSMYRRLPLAGKFLGGAFAVLDAPFVAAATTTYEVADMTASAACGSREQAGGHFSIRTSGVSCEAYLSTDNLVDLLSTNEEALLVMLRNGPKLCEAFRRAYDEISVSHNYRAQCAPDGSGVSLIPRSDEDLPRWNFATSNKRSILSRVDGEMVDKGIYGVDENGPFADEQEKFSKRTDQEERKAIFGQFGAMRAAVLIGDQCCKLKTNDPLCKGYGLSFNESSNKSPELQEGEQ